MVVTSAVRSSTMSVAFLSEATSTIRCASAAGSSMAFGAGSASCVLLAVRVDDDRGVDRGPAPPPLAGQGSGWRGQPLLARESASRSRRVRDRPADGCGWRMYRIAHEATRLTGPRFR